MPLHRARLLLLWAELGFFVPGSRCGSPRHSLCYSYLKVSKSSRGLPQFHSMVHLDDHPIARYDTHTSKMESLVPWMEVVELTTLVALERVFRADLEWLSQLNHQTTELHTWQVIMSCDIKEDRSKGGFLHYGYNGRDFISFDKETLRWVTAQPQAQKVKEKWEEDPGKSQRNKAFLEETCIKMMQKYLPYQKEALKKTEPPVGKVTCKVVDDRLEVLICQAFGFYPKEIQAIWMRDGEVCQYESLHRNVAPNSDGTYYIWLNIEIDPKERDHFRCRLEHEGLQEPLVLALKEETVGTVFLLVTVGCLIMAPVTVSLVYYCLRCRKKLHQEVTTCPDHFADFTYEEEIQSEVMYPPQMVSEPKVYHGGWWSQKGPRPFHRQEMMLQRR